MATHADREWRLIREESRKGPVNMALDEVAAATAAAGGLRTLRVYRWSPSTLSLGYRQDPATVDWEYCERKGVTVTRRPTGGGGIYHDSWGDISYSIIAPAEELPENLMDTYELLCEPIFEGFERLGVPATFAEQSQPAIHQPACYLRELHPAHDVVVPEPGGARKLSGNAQYRRKDAIIQHGSITFEATPERHLGVFAAPETSPEEFRGRVTSMREHTDASREEAIEAIEESLGEWADAEEGDWADAELERARDRADRKFGRSAWTRERVDPLD